MERTVPRTGSEEIELYLRTYYSLLRTSDEVRLRTLEETHTAMHSLLHPDARGNTPDMSAFVYSVLRLPDCIGKVQLVLLGQGPEVFARAGLEVESWQPVAARARRRRCFFDGERTLACYIASRSDIDDLIPILTAFQIEWNKLRRLLLELPPEALDGRGAPDGDLARALHISPDDLGRLHAIWGDRFWMRLAHIRDHRLNLRVRLLNGSLSEYRRATNRWWQRIEEACPDLLERPVYFVSSNPHSVVNLLSGLALQHHDRLLDWLHRSDDAMLQQEWRDIQSRQVPSNRENFFYYLLKKYLATPEGADLLAHQTQHEADVGIRRIPAKHTFDVEAQVIEIARLRPDWMDPRLDDAVPEVMRHSPAYILNIDYPLGMGAYHILSVVAERVAAVRGVYVMGKAATLNGVIGDVMIPGVVHDEHSQNTYLFPNCFTAGDVSPYLVYGTVLDNQKAVTVRGTFLQTARYMDVFYREGYTDIEMEAGPYLSAVYEMARPKRHPVNEIVNLYGVPFDLGFLHYASDTPLSKGKNLGAGSLSYFGMDPTYATSIAILRRIFRHLSMEDQTWPT